MALTPEQFALVQQRWAQADAEKQGVGGGAPGGGDFFAEDAAKYAAAKAERKRLEQENSKLATGLTQFARGALDAAMWAPPIVAAGLEGVGAVTGWSGLEEFGRDLGESAQGSEAIKALAFGATAGDVETFDAVDRKLKAQEKTWPTLSAFSRAGGQIAAGLGIGLAGAASKGAIAGLATVEGAGAGAQVAYENQAAIEDVWISATIGGALAGTTTLAVTHGVGALKRKLLTREAANENALRATNMRGSDMRKLGGEEAVQEVGEAIRTFKTRDGNQLLEMTDNVDTLKPKLEKAVKELGQEIGDIRARADVPGELPDVHGFIRRVDDEVLNPIRASDSDEVRKLAPKIEEQYMGVMESVAEGADVSFDRLRKLHRSVKAKVYGVKQEMKGPMPPPKPALESFQRMERILDETIDGHVQLHVKPSEFARYKEVKKLYSLLEPARAGAEKAMGQNLGNRTLSPSDMWTGMAVGGGSVASGNIGQGLLHGVAASLVHRQVRERGSAFMARMYSEGLETTVIPRVARTVLQGVTSTRTAAFRGIADAHHRPTLTLSQQHDRYEKDLDRVARLGTLDNSAHIEESIQGLDPQMGAAVVAGYQQRVQQLLADLPKPATSTTRRQGKLNSKELRTARAMIEATQDPMSVFDDMAAGSLNPEKAKYAWKQYPGLKTASELAVMDIIQFQLSDDARAKIPMSMLTQLDLTLGLGGKLAPLVRPSFLAMMEQARQEQEQEAQQGGGGRAINLPSAEPTMNQRIAGNLRK